jgi:tetrapyrrole methylase family protein/MazG family protein
MQAAKRSEKRPDLPEATASDIRIVGLGPGAMEDLTLGAWRALTTAGRVMARTRHHPCLAILSDTISYGTYDDVYEDYTEFADVYAEIARRVVRLGSQQAGVVYAVPGHPWVGEATTPLILQHAQEVGLSVSVVNGLSFVEASYGAIAVDIMDGGQVLDGMILARHHYPKVDVGLPLLVGQLYARWLASDVKLVLLNAYPEGHPVTLVNAASTPDQRLRTVELHELDHTDDFDHLTSLYVPPLGKGSFTDLQEIVAHLRSPLGCPWDREQTLETLRHGLLDECAEVLEAIDAESDGSDNSEHIAEEVGDLLLVATMLVQIASEEGRFRMADSIHGVVTKLIRRHPHVFGDVAVDNVDEVLTNWDAIKAAEKAAKGQVIADPLDGVPAHLPALEKARMLQGKAAKAGLLDRTALARSLPALREALDRSPAERALGGLLWGLVALAHEYDINAEDALRSHLVRYRQEQAE